MIERVTCKAAIKLIRPTKIERVFIEFIAIGARGWVRLTKVEAKHLLRELHTMKKDDRTIHALVDIDIQAHAAFISGAQ